MKVKFQLFLVFLAIAVVLSQFLKTGVSKSNDLAPSSTEQSSLTQQLTQKQPQNAVDYHDRGWHTRVHKSTIRQLPISI